LNNFFYRFPFGSDDVGSEIDVILDSESDISDAYSDSEQDQDTDGIQLTNITGSNGNSSFTTIFSEDEYSSEEEFDDEEYDTNQLGGGVLNEKIYDLLLKNLKVLRQTRALVTFIRNHRVTRDFLGKQITNQSIGDLIVDMKIRWYSTHIMLERFIHYKDVIQAIVNLPETFRNSLKKPQQRKLKNLALNHNEWDLLQIISSLLEPFRHATVLLSGQTYPTLSLAYYVIKALENFLSIDDDEPEVACAIKKSLRAQFMYYFDTNVSKEQKDLTLVSRF
jgi:hypothetical protein